MPFWIEKQFSWLNWQKMRVNIKHGDAYSHPGVKYFSSHKKAIKIVMQMSWRTIHKRINKMRNAPRHKMISNLRLFNVKQTIEMAHFDPEKTSVEWNTKKSYTFDFTRTIWLSDTRRCVSIVPPFVYSDSPFFHLDPRPNTLKFNFPFLLSIFHSSSPADSVASLQWPCGAR